MDARIQKLLQAFQVNGWAYAGLADISSDWWFTDVLHLTSTWRPLEKNLYLVLLTDPEMLREKIVWCIGISSIPPVDKDFYRLAKLTLNDIRKTDLNEFVKKINRIVLI